jgi:hypothetical protein
MPYPEPRGNEHEATRFHRSAWWCGCLMATRCACPAACKAGDRIPGDGIPIDVRLPYRGNPARFARFRLCRGHEYHNRVPLAEGRYERLPELAAELVRSNVDLIITHGIPGRHRLAHCTCLLLTQSGMEHPFLMAHACWYSAVP